MLFFFIGCQPQTDSELYLGALAEEDPGKCLEISAPDIAGDCLSALVVKTPHAAHWHTTCTQIDDSEWQGECFFQLSDAGAHIGDSARSICAKASPFSEDCLRHAAARDVEQKVNLGELTQAQRLMPRIYSLLKEYLPDPIAQPMARDMLVRMVAQAKPNLPFSKVFCEGLSVDTCIQIYIVRSLGSGHQESNDDTWREHCGASINISTADSLGWASYTPNMQDTVSKAWKQVCQKPSQ